MKKLFSIALGLVAAAFISVSANAQTYSDVTKYTGSFGNRSATITSASVPAFDNVQDTRANLTVIASSSVPGISATLTLSTKDDSIVSQTSLTLFQTSSTVVSFNGPLNFQKARLTLNAPGNASAKVNLVQSR